MDFFSTGYRADKIYDTLKDAKNLTPSDFAHLQTNIQDVLASELVPKLLGALQGVALTPRERAAAAILAAWRHAGYTMAVSLPAPSIWWVFMNQYVKDTFSPWWRADRVPVADDPNLALTINSEIGTPLVEDLEAWTLHDPSNPAFNEPQGVHRNASTVMMKAFRDTVSILSRKLGPNPTTWRWGRLHYREFLSLTGIAALGYGPRPASGDIWTVDAADGGLVAKAGPSWRMIVNWGAHPNQAPFAEGVYPGGQSENPLSPWYRNQIVTWWDGRYLPMPVPGSTQTGRDAPTWTLTP